MEEQDIVELDPGYAPVKIEATETDEYGKDCVWVTFQTRRGIMDVAQGIVSLEEHYLDLRHFLDMAVRRLYESEVKKLTEKISGNRKEVWDLIRLLGEK